MAVLGTLLNLDLRKFSRLTAVLSKGEHLLTFIFAETALMALVLVETGLPLLHSLLVLTVHHKLAEAQVLADGIPTRSHALLIAMHMETHLQIVVAVTLLLVVVATDNGVMASTSLDLLIHVSSVSFSAYLMTQPSNKLVSTSRSTTIFPSRLQVTMFLSQFSNSPTLLWTTISSRTLSWLTTRSQLQSKSIPFPSSWVVVT